MLQRKTDWFIFEMDFFEKETVDLLFGLMGHFRLSAFDEFLNSYFTT
jgi:hypothetical protein